MQILTKKYDNIPKAQKYNSKLSYKLFRIENKRNKEERKKRRKKNKEETGINSWM